MVAVELDKRRKWKQVERSKRGSRYSRLECNKLLAQKVECPRLSSFVHFAGIVIVKSQSYHSGPAISASA